METLLASLGALIIFVVFICGLLVEFGIVKVKIERDGTTIYTNDKA